MIEFQVDDSRVVSTGVWAKKGVAMRVHFADDHPPDDGGGSGGGDEEF
jgi:hypothetical protein